MKWEEKRGKIPIRVLIKLEKGFKNFQYLVCNIFVKKYATEAEYFMDYDFTELNDRSALKQ